MRLYLREVIVENKNEILEMVEKIEKDTIEKNLKV